MVGSARRIGAFGSAGEGAFGRLCNVVRASAQRGDAPSSTPQECAEAGDWRSRLSKIKRPVADWNSLKLHVFLLRMRVHLTIQKLVTAGSRPMIVCSCNVLSDHDVRATMHSEGGPARNPGEVHRCLGCSRKCGRCMHTIKNIMNEALCGAAERRAGS
ncbi:(2Fe-2S)-binding protein [Rhodopseudomonas palustris]|uniref:(2Fe-2S)-binding protein n=1 Tax=Rhodopseudomonas palustris TaxID=1076 RepID=UPI00322145C6